MAGNKLISGSHGYVERDADGRVWFNDTSTNGSLLNLVTKVNKNVSTFTSSTRVNKLLVDHCMLFS